MIADAVIDVAVGELDGGQAVSFDDESLDLALDDPDAAGGERGGLRGVGPEHTERLVTDLPAVAVRAVEQILSPSLPNAGNVGKLVAEPGGDQHALGRQRSAIAAVDVEARFDANDDVIDELHVVAGDLGATDREELGRGTPSRDR